MFSHSGPAHSLKLITRHKTARPSHCGRGLLACHIMLQIPSSPVPTHPQVKSNVSAVMRAGAGAAELPLRSFPQKVAGVLCMLCFPASRPITPSTGPQPPPVPTLSLTSLSSPSSTEIITEIHGDHRDPRRSPQRSTEITARRARARGARSGSRAQAMLRRGGSPHRRGASRCRYSRRLACRRCKSWRAR